MSIDSRELATKLKSMAEASYHVLVDVARSPSIDGFPFAHQTLWDIGETLRRFTAHALAAPAPEVQLTMHVEPDHAWAVDLHEAAEHLNWVAGGLRTALIEAVQHADEEEWAWAAHQMLLEATWALTQLECVHAKGEP
ncbi:hypothetical protein LYSHEL_29050 [Lysobacter helvus]|uniref:Uncharacterized protein n=2 Tax=Lysobacteraceae TaxID=32033 RepID=A0ABN6FW55_9GAMM|nr:MULTISPECIES: hypothetical protein [Lysobacter]BCT93878.1 hypothetical protein LYSCAS_29020 [Lysobacter caseinilyticus]BCT97034.1 hypothetical protein LYSHEL_29050 [Lysobacter helvus]